MSTRATYQFVRPRHGGRFTIYIHHDGYPLGAAEYLARAVLGCNASGPWSAWLGGSLVEEFIRQNDRAELTAEHDQHGDTDYRYTLSRPTAEEHGPDVQERGPQPASASFPACAAPCVQAFRAAPHDPASQRPKRKRDRATRS